jgi:multidrug efflux system membrane fusion protein
MNHLPLRRLTMPLLSALLLAACSRPAPTPEPVRAVRTQLVSADSAIETQEFAAEVRARTESRLGFRVGGKLLAREVEVGQRVKRGQVLARLDPADLRLGEQAAQAGVQAAQANHDLAAADLRRYQELRAQGFISAIELDRRQTTLQAARAQLDQARAQAGVQGNQAGYAALTATAAGVITAVDAEPGTVLASGAPVLRLAHDGPRDVVFAIPEDQAAAMRALIGRSGALQVRAWGAAKTMPATLREVAAAADPSTRTFLAKADTGSAALELGQTATVLLQRAAPVGVNKLPLSAVVQQQGRTAVWLVDRGSMTVKVQPIVVAGAEGNTVLVAAGLAPGQTVVTAGVHTLSPGQKVKLYQDSAAAPAAPASGSAASR